MAYNLNYVFPKKREAIEKFADKFVLKESKYVEVYDNATILPVVKYDDYDVMHGRGGVVNEEGDYVDLSKTKARVIGKYDFESEQCDFIDKKVVYCGFLYKVWGHFITEVVSRLWYALENDDTIDAYVFVDKLDGNNKFTGNYLNFLKLLGIEDKVIMISKPTRFTQVVVPEDGFVYGEHYTQAFIDMYKYINKVGLSQYNGPKYEKVYFSKNKIISSLESNLNSKFLDKYFKNNGFKIFYPEKLSLVDTIGIIQNCDYFCGISSSLAHNQLFGHSKQTMISIEKQAFYNPYQIFVGKITGCNMVFIDAFRHIFPVCSGGPFLYDYTEYFDKFAKDFGLKSGKPMSNFKYKRMFKKYMVFYFDLNYTLPPDWMYRQSVIDMSREMYNDTIAKGKPFHMSFYNRVIMKLRKILFNWLGPY